MIGDDTTSKYKTVASGGAAASQVVAMSGVNITSKFEEIGGIREGWKIRIVSRTKKRDELKIQKGGRTPIDNTPIDSLAKI